MSDDKMRAEFEAWAESQDCIAHRGEGGSYWHPDVRKAWKVWQAAYAAGQKAEREAIFIEWENGELLAAEVERLRAVNQIFEAANVRLATELERVQAELAAAKAASGCPVELVSLGDADWECIVGVKSGEDTDRLYNWLRDRMKDATPPQT